MDQFPSNSQNLTPLGQPPKTGKARKERTKVEAVVTGPVIAKPPGIARKFKNLFGGEFKNATSYVFMDVLIPAFRDMMFNAASKGAERMIYPDSQIRTRSDPRGTRVTYNSSIDREYRRDPRERSAMLPDQPPHRRRGAGIDLQDIYLTSRGEADLVVESLTDILERNDVATVADYYDLLRMPSAWTDNDWGWDRLEYVSVRQTRLGYIIDLPRPQPL